jgi:hypothetical protein
MVIYGNNLHEKLQGIAISKDYIKYATPFCDFVDDPELAPDIDLAVGFNQAINGDVTAANTFTDTLILSGYLFDMSTKEFYRDKMLSNPKVWGTQIKKIQQSFETNAFEDALKDCLNSPCNLFAETSDSVARMAQVASTKNGSNSFGVGDLSATFVNIANGLDEAVTKKLPAIFGDAALELTQNIKSARSNIEAVVAGKKNLNELTSLANASGTMRGTNKIYRYTPDLKSYTDYTNLGNTILLKAKQTLGGCFERFESAYRYNPYKDNTSVPATAQQQQFNGAQFKLEPNGVKLGSPITVRILNAVFDLFGPEDDGELTGEDLGGAGGSMLPALGTMPGSEGYIPPLPGDEVTDSVMDAMGPMPNPADEPEAYKAWEDEYFATRRANFRETELKPTADLLVEVYDKDGDGKLSKGERPRPTVQKDANGNVLFITTMDENGFSDIDDSGFRRLNS